MKLFFLILMIILNFSAQTIFGMDNEKYEPNGNIPFSSNKAIMLNEIHIHHMEEIKVSLHCNEQRIETWHTITSRYYTKLVFPKQILICTSPEQVEILADNIFGFHIIDKSAIISLTCFLALSSTHYTYHLNFPLETYLTFFSTRENKLDLQFTLNMDNTLTLKPNVIVGKEQDTASLYITALPSTS